MSAETGGLTDAEQAISADHGHWAASAFPDAIEPGVEHIVCECGLPWAPGEGCPFVQGVRMGRADLAAKVEAAEGLLTELRDWGAALADADRALNCSCQRAMVQSSSVGRDLIQYADRLRAAIVAGSAPRKAEDYTLAAGATSRLRRCTRPRRPSLPERSLRLAPLRAAHPSREG